MPHTTTPAPDTPARRRPHGLRLALAAVAGYLVISYVVLPIWWRRHEHHHPALAEAPVLTHTAEGIPGDPLNIALVGSQHDLHVALFVAGWYPADPLTLRSALRIAAGVVFERPYDDAPVSNLYLWNRKEDLACEQPVGNDPRRRHHVRFWRSARLDAAGRPLWIGAATLDTRVGLSHTTGAITHHIGADVDAERDKIIRDLEEAGALVEAHWVAGFHKVLSGKNGGGDPWHTDGRLAVGILRMPARVAPGDRRPGRVPATATAPAATGPSGTQ